MEILQGIVDFFVFVVEMLGQLVELVGMGIETLTSLIAMLPPAVSISAGVLITVCVLYKVLGRENQS